MCNITRIIKRFRMLLPNPYFPNLAHWLGLLFFFFPEHIHAKKKKEAQSWVLCGPAYICLTLWKHGRSQRQRKRKHEGQVKEICPSGCLVASRGIRLGTMAAHYAWSGCEANTRGDSERRTRIQRGMERREGNGAKNETAPL